MKREDKHTRERQVKDFQGQGEKKKAMSPQSWQVGLSITILKNKVLVCISISCILLCPLQSWFQGFLQLSCISLFPFSVAFMLLAVLGAVLSNDLCNPELVAT